MSCIGVILLVVLLEGLRRAQRELDRYLLFVRARARASAARMSQHQHQQYQGGGDTPPEKVVAASQLEHYSGSSRLKLWEHALRSTLYMFQFAVGYFVMLLAMYYNGLLLPFRLIRFPLSRLRLTC